MLTVSGKRFDECSVLVRYSAELHSCSLWLCSFSLVKPFRLIIPVTGHSFSQSDQINMRSLSVARAHGPVQDWPDQRAQLFCHTHSLTFCNEQEWASDSHMQDAFTIATYHISHTSVYCTCVIFFCR